MPYTFLIFFALLSGIALALEIGVNSQLQFFLGHPIQATLISVWVAGITLLIGSLFLDLNWPSINEVLQTEWWLWIGGILGAFYVFSTIFLAPKLGSSILISLVIAGQMMISLVLDHYGWLGFPQQSVNAWRILGAGFLLVGVVLIQHN